MARLAQSSAITAALGAAVLFGASPPLAKQLLRDTSPMLLAGLLYLGSGIGLSAGRLLRDRGWRTPMLARAEWLWLLLAIGFGGVLGPLLLMLGLARTPAAATSLLLNLEAVFTALLAWIVFRENTDRRVVLGMALIVAGAAALAWRGPSHTAGFGGGALLITLACLCWALDNNLTRKVSASDAAFLAGIKGLSAGAVNTGLALLLGARLQGPAGIGAAMVVGLFGYGISLMLFVLALRGLGAARTGRISPRRLSWARPWRSLPSASIPRGRSGWQRSSWGLAYGYICRSGMGTRTLMRPSRTRIATSTTSITSIPTISTGTGASRIRTNTRTQC